MLRQGLDGAALAFEESQVNLCLSVQRRVSWTDIELLLHTLVDRFFLRNYLLVFLDQLLRDDAVLAQENVVVPQNAQRIAQKRV